MGTLVGEEDDQVLKRKHIDGKENDIAIYTQNMDDGENANANTFWNGEGDGNWRGITFPRPAVDNFSAALSGADIALTTLGTHYDGPRVAQGSEGVFYAIGKVRLGDSASGGGATFLIFLTDGTNIFGSDQLVIDGDGHMTVAIFGIISNPAGDIRIEVAQTARPSGAIIGHGSIFVNDSGQGHDCQICVIRIG